MHRFHHLPGSGIPRPFLLAILLLSAAAPGCQVLSARRPPGEAKADAKADGSTGPILFPEGPPPASPASPTAPEPMPELTSQRSADIHLDLGRVFEARGQYDAAEGEYRGALEAVDRKVDRATRAEIHRRLASTLDRQGKFAESAPHHLDATKLAPRDASAWNDAGYSAYLQGNWDEAVRMLRKAEELEPDDARILTNLGLALAADGRRDEAVAAFSRAGGPAAAQANLAFVLAATGRTDEAREHYQQALELNPEHALARRAIGRLDATIAPATAIASRPTPVDPAVAPASFEPIEPPAIPPPDLGPGLPGIPPPAVRPMP